MGIEPKDILLLLIGWAVTKLLDYIVAMVGSSVQKNKNNNKKNKKKPQPKPTNRKRRK